MGFHPDITTLMSIANVGIHIFVAALTQNHPTKGEYAEKEDVVTSLLNVVMPHL